MRKKTEELQKCSRNGRSFFYTPQPCPVPSHATAPILKGWGRWHHPEWEGRDEPQAQALSFLMWWGWFVCF